jgi:hypothetical protein
MNETAVACRLRAAYCRLVDPLEMPAILEKKEIGFKPFFPGASALTPTGRQIPSGGVHRPEGRIVGCKA